MNPNRWMYSRMLRAVGGGLVAFGIVLFLIRLLISLAYPVSAVMMLEHMKWQEAADLVVNGMADSIKDGHVTYDLARLMKREGRKDVTEVSCSGFGQAIIDRM